MLLLQTAAGREQEGLTGAESEIGVPFSHPSSQCGSRMGEEGMEAGNLTDLTQKSFTELIFPGVMWSQVLLLWAIFASLMLLIYHAKYSFACDKIHSPNLTVEFGDF